MLNKTCMYTSNGYSYEFFNKRISFAHANRECTERGGDLAANLNEGILQDFRVNCGAPDRDYWIGLRRDRTCQEENTRFRHRWINNGTCVNFHGTFPNQRILNGMRPNCQSVVTINLGQGENTTNLTAQCRNSFICQTKIARVLDDNFNPSSIAPTNETLHLNPALSTPEIAAICAGVGGLVFLFLMCYVMKFFCAKCKTSKTKRLRLDSKFVLLNKEALQEHIQQHFGNSSTRQNVENTSSIPVSPAHSNLNSFQHNVKYFPNTEENKNKTDELDKEESVYENLSNDGNDSQKRESMYENLSDTDEIKKDGKERMYENLSNPDDDKDGGESAYENLSETNSDKDTEVHKSELYQNIPETPEESDGKKEVKDLYENLSDTNEYLELDNPGEQIPSIESYASKEFRVYVNASEEDGVYLEPNVYDSQINIEES